MTEKDNNKENNESKKETKVRKDMPIAKVMEIGGHEAAKILMSRGLHCIGCHAAMFETLEQGCMAHGMGPEIVDEIVEEINKAISNLTSEKDNSKEKETNKKEEKQDQKKEEK